MTPLPHPDRFHTNAALGWLMLNNLDEAAAEFAKVAEPYRAHPDCLQVQCQLHILSKRWHEALRVSHEQLRISPGQPHGWINHAYCLHELKRTREAFAILLPAARRFPTHNLISFNLACYCYHLEKFSEALRWVNQTIRLIERKEHI